MATAATIEEKPAILEDSVKAAIIAAVDADPRLERATVALPKDALEWLREQARKRGISTGEMLRTAVGTQKFLMDQIAKGGKVQVKDSNGTFDLTI